VASTFERLKKTLPHSKFYEEETSKNIHIEKKINKSLTSHPDQPSRIIGIINSKEHMLTTQSKMGVVQSLGGGAAVGSKRGVSPSKRKFQSVEVRGKQDKTENNEDLSSESSSQKRKREEPHHYPQRLDTPKLRKMNIISHDGGFTELNKQIHQSFGRVKAAKYGQFTS
jgi:hypothetical protein